MTRPHLAWLFTLPLTAAGSLFAHALGYRLVAPQPTERTELLAASGHGYLAYAPLFLALCAGVVLCGAGWWTVATYRGRAPRLAALPFALLPPLYFTFQEHLERFTSAGGLPAGTALEATFVVGLALQLPFAVAALLIACTLLRVAEGFAGALLRRQSVVQPPAVFLASWRPVLATSGGGPTALGRGYSERGPPLTL